MRISFLAAEEKQKKTNIIDLQNHFLKLSAQEPRPRLLLLDLKMLHLHVVLRYLEEKQKIEQINIFVKIFTLSYPPYL